MAPFCAPTTVISGIKEKIDSLLVQGDRLFLGSSTGNLHVYSTERREDNSSFDLLDIRKGLARRSIEQLGFVKDVNSLVVLSEMNVTLFPLPAFSPPTPLQKARAAFSFSVHSSVHNELPSPSLVTHLLVGCRRKAVLYTWIDGQPQDAREAPLPHSARSISFINADTACFAYSPTEYAMFTLSTMTATDIVTPLPTTASTGAMGAFTGFTGYMTLGLMAKPKPMAVHVQTSEALITRDVEGIFVGPDAKPSRTATLEWPVPVEDLAVVKPYVLAVLPAGTVPTPQSEAAHPTYHPTSVLQIHSSLSLHVSQSIPLPPDASVSSATTLRLLTPSPAAKPSLFLLSTPNDRTAAANEGSSIWELEMRPWDAQLDELVLSGQYSDALSLLDSLDEESLPDKSERRTRIRALNAVAQFRAGKFDEAIDTFIELDFNPAKVVALYPEAVSGRLAVPPERWIPLYGGLVPIDGNAGGTQDSHSVNSNLQEGSSTPVFEHPSLKDRLHLKVKDDDAVSITGRRRGQQDPFHRSVETLVRFLTDRRPKLFKSLEGVKITPENQTEQYPPLSQTSIDELFLLPDAPLSALTPEQLLRFAQIIDTALYKSYLIIRPTLLSSLCRVANWCEVSELEEDLRKRKKFFELKDLYHGKGMHAEALDMLREVGKDESDIEERLDPSIRYLQKLGPNHLSQIFESARWIFETDKDMAFNIFLSDEVVLPRRPVADYLEKIDPKLCIRYLEHILFGGSDDEMGERDESTEFYDRLAELYLNQTLSSQKRGDSELRDAAYTKLLSFIDTDQHFAVDRLYGLVSSTDLHEARAVLLGRLGRHDQALELYVYRLQDYFKAEQYCKRVYRSGAETSGIFLTLLRIYLRPTSTTVDASELLHPALDLIRRHSPRLDSVEVLQLLPPLVTTQDVKELLINALRVPLFDARVVSHVSKARKEQVTRKLVNLQTRRVKVTDTRICPQCHKRLGNSVIAVHSPHGEVTHYQCREAFSRRRAEVQR